MNLITFGEVLFDVFNDYERIGGAPLNVSAHFSKLGGTSKIISSIGNDERGKKIINFTENYKIDKTFLNTQKQPTGIATINLKDGIPSYEFNANCSWDNIYISNKQIEKLKNSKCDVFYFGTLAQRSDISKTTLSTIKQYIKPKEVFFDVNFRKKYFSKQSLIEGFYYCTILKINDDEVKIIKDLFNWTNLNEIELLYKLSEDYSINTILVTKGEKGIIGYHKKEIFHQKAQEVEVVDTVGAGDSFTAGFLFYYLTTKDIKKAMQKGAKLADYVVTQKGAIPEYNKDLLCK